MSGMPGKIPRHVSSRIIVFMLLTFMLTGCSHFGRYLDFWKTERTKKKEFSIEPTAMLLRDLQPGDSFMLAGPVNQKTNYDGPVLVAAVTDSVQKT